MPRELTDGFDLAAQIPEEMLRKVFRASFLRLLQGLNQTVAGGQQLTLWFESASLSLLPKPLPFVNPIEVSLPFLARLSDQYDEVRGTISIRTQVTQVQVGSGADSFIAPIIDFQPNAIESFVVGGLSPEAHAIWAPPITSAVKPTLDRISPFTAGPLFPQRNAQYFLNTDPEVPYGTGAGALGVYIWTGGGTAPRPPANITPRRLSADEAVALVPRDRIEQAIEAGLQANGLRNLPKDVGEVTITAFNYQWRDFGVGDGHFYFTGKVDHWLGDVSFEAWIKLWVQQGTVKVRVVRTDHDGSFLVDVADLFSAGAITRTLEEILPRAVGSVGGAAFGNLGVFASDTVPEPQAFARMEVSGNIGIWPSGLSIPADLVSADVSWSFPPPTYLLGHPVTREFHAQFCEYGRLIKNPARFPTWMRAIQIGYNGCWFCQSSRNVVAIGQLFVEVAGEATPMPKVTARLTSEVKRFDVVVTPPEETLQGKFGWDEEDQARTYRSKPLVPGTWEVTVTHEDWSITTTAEVGKAWMSNGVTHGTATLVHVAVGSDEASSELVPPRL